MPETEAPKGAGDEWEILAYPDKRLRKVSETITEITDDLKKKGLALMDLMHQARGIGLAAPQVGWHVRILAINLSGKRRDGLIFLNPEIKSVSKATFAASEMCLSVPGISGKVVRPREAVITSMNFDGELNEFTLDGLLARCFLHEYDHLDGKLFIDKLSPAKKLSIRKKLRRLGGPE
jgi:peptide deformylase